MSSLQNKTFNGIIWSAIHRFGTMGITFVSNIVLARLLSPDDFGCIGMLMIFISLANTFIDGGFGSALIQKKTPTKEDYSTIFYWNLLLAVLLYCVIFICAPHIATFYEIPKLSSVLRVQAIILFFNALSIVQQNILRKQLLFKKLAVVNIVSAILSLIIAVVAAYNSFGVWSLVLQQLSLSFLNAVLFWVVSKWRPLLIFSYKSFKELFKFGGYILLSHLFSTLSNEFQGLLVGKMFTPAAMGQYSQAYRLEGSIATATSSIIDQVTYPVLSSLQDQKGQFVGALKRFIQVPAFICAPIMMIMIVIAEPLITFLYTAKWLECVPYFQILCTAGLAVCLQGAANNAIAAVGKSNVLFNWTIAKRSLTIVLCIGGICIGGMHGLLWGCSLGAWSVFIINAWLVEKHIGYSVFNQLMDIIPSMMVAVFVGLIIHYFGELVDINMYICAILQAIVGLALYLLSAYILDFDAFKYTKNLILRKLNK